MPKRSESIKKSNFKRFATKAFESNPEDKSGELRRKPTIKQSTNLSFDFGELLI